MGSPGYWSAGYPLALAVETYTVIPEHISLDMENHRFVRLVQEF